MEPLQDPSPLSDLSRPATQTQLREWVVEVTVRINAQAARIEAQAARIEALEARVTELENAP